MVTPTSRRAFLTGRRAPVAPWDQFCTRLARSCLGPVRVDRAAGGLTDRAQAWLEPMRLEDVGHARALCLEYGVSFVLDGCPGPTEARRSVLWVTPLMHGAKSDLVDAERDLWRVDAGCKLSDLQETGLFPAVGQAADTTVAQWFASAGAGCRVDQATASCSVEQAEVMLADGTTEILGPFGATAQSPLRSLTLQRMVPRLFELAGSELALRCAQVRPWPAVYRLDALIAAKGREPNLAQLLLGHQGRLGWVQTLWLRRATQSAAMAQCEVFLESLPEFAAQLDQELKYILDPRAVFG